ncbi:hypothetical protein CKAH01_11277 [Colletotrichum kahawae]|uniref:2EXR domain-containing protein n=1 Tax=Colletotrichum kahawae TaxID=34407 RepID=A0AAE0CXX4_COLKA|nr:hypothetical protein CKAH01_11277 [Colletotrichum kahawae]
MRKPQVVLEDLLSNAIVGGHFSTDKRFVKDLLNLAHKNYPEAPSIHKNSCFEKFRQLPIEIREQIWLLSIPARTLHATDHTRERIAWNRRLPMPAPALSCREAWAILRPLIHGIYDNGRVKMSNVNKERTAWITSRDTLNIGPSGGYAVSLHADYGPKLPQFGHIVLCLEQIKDGLRMGSISDICDQRDGFNYYELERIGILIHEVEIVIPIGLALREQLFVSRDDFPGWTCDYEKCSVWGCNPHFVEVVNMRDNRRIEELLNLHIAWATGGCAWSREERLDRETWWQTEGYSQAKEAMAMMKALELWDKPPNGRTARVPSLDFIRQSALPELIPTVKFVFKFPGCSPPGITMERVHALRGECSDVCHISNGFPPGWSNFPGQEVERA